MADKEKVIKGLEEAINVLTNHAPERYLGYSACACLAAMELREKLNVMIENDNIPVMIVNKANGEWGLEYKEGGIKRD